MVIYYLAAVCPQKYYEILYPNGAVSPAYTFNKLLAEGLGSIEEIEVNCIVPKVVIDKLGVYQTAEKKIILIIYLWKIDLRERGI